MAEGARLESVYAGNRIEGSNPSPSASLLLFKIICLAVPAAREPKGGPQRRPAYSAAPSGAARRYEDGPRACLRQNCDSSSRNMVNEGVRARRRGKTSHCAPVSSLGGKPQKRVQSPSPGASTAFRGAAQLMRET